MSPATEPQVRDEEMHHAPAGGGREERPRPPESAERAFWSWFGFWVQILVLAVLAVIGAFAASGAERPGDYACGMILILGAVALAFLRLRNRLDGGSSGLVQCWYFMAAGALIRSWSATRRFTKRVRATSISWSPGSWD